MNAQSATFKIDTILFNNMDTKVQIKGETIKNHFVFESEMFISFSELNALMNYLQLINPSISVSDLMMEELEQEYFSSTTIDVHSLENRTIDMQQLDFLDTQKLIRA